MPHDRRTISRPAAPVPQWSSSRGSLSIASFMRDRFAGRIGDELRDAVDKPQRHLQHAARIAHRRARLQRTERDDVRDAVFAIFVLHIAHDFVAPLLAEIDVEVRHRDAFGIEEALEQQAEADRIEIGDVERPGDERSGAGAAHADGNALLARPFHEIGHDEEVARKIHADDDAELESEPVAIDLLVGEQTMFLQPAREAGFGLRLQFFGGRKTGFGDEFRQDGIALLGTECAALRDLDRVLDRFRQIGELRRHFRRRFESMLARQAACDPAARRRCHRRCRAARHALHTYRRRRNAHHWSRRAECPFHRRDRSEALPRRVLPADRDAATRHRAGRQTSLSAGRAVPTPRPAGLPR